MVQSLPPISGRGLSQKRLLSSIPPPQSASHGSQGDHMLYPPSTVQVNGKSLLKLRERYKAVDESSVT